MQRPIPFPRLFPEALVGFLGVGLSHPRRVAMRRQAKLCRVAEHCARTERSRGKAAACPARCRGAGAARNAARPETLDGVDVDLAEPVAILIAGVFAAPMADRLVAVAPAFQAGVDAILVGVDQGAWGDDTRDDRLDRFLLHVGQHVQDHLAAALDQAGDGWLVLLQRAPTRRSCQPAAPLRPPLFATSFCWPLCPATT